MRIIIAGTIQGDSGYEEKILIEKLEKELISLGYITDSFILPYTRDTLMLPEAIAVMKLIDFLDCDMLITVGYPACFIPHRNKKVFLFQTAPAIFEYLNSEYGVLENDEYKYIKEIVENAEKNEFSISKIFCGSNLLKKDIESRYGVQCNTLFLDDMVEMQYDSKYTVVGEYFISETDLYPEERIDEILIPAIQQCKGKKLVLCIPRTTEMYRNALEDQIRELDIHDRVILVNKIMSNELLEHSIAYINTSINKRKISWGIIRAMKQGKRIILTDSNFYNELRKIYNNIVITDDLCKTFNYIDKIIKTDSALKLNSAKDLAYEMVKE